MAIYPEVWPTLDLAPEMVGMVRTGILRTTAMCLVKSAMLNLVKS